jgi:hypothetical protein
VRIGFSYPFQGLEQGIGSKGKGLPFFEPGPLVVNACHKNIHGLRSLRAKRREQRRIDVCTPLRPSFEGSGIKDWYQTFRSAS